MYGVEDILDMLLWCFLQLLSTMAERPFRQQVDVLASA